MKKGLKSYVGYLISGRCAGCNPAKKEESASKDQKSKKVNADWFQDTNHTGLYVSESERLL